MQLTEWTDRGAEKRQRKRKIDRGREHLPLSHLHQSRTELRLRDPWSRDDCEGSRSDTGASPSSSCPSLSLVHPFLRRT